MKHFSLAEIQTWERFYRANFINSLTGFKSVSLISTKNANGQTNLGVFSSIVHIGSNPALVGYINRPLEAAPHTLANIEATKFYTINHIQPSFVGIAHQTSAKYDAAISEFDAVGLTPEYLHNFEAPFVQESQVKYGLELQEIMPIKLNNTFLVIGKIICAYLNENIIQADGFLQLEKANSMASNGIDAYYETNLHSRYEYAKPEKISQKI
jgi:flavin reductase (DIM6/NTAB) family NADH-FMN oxidoreductase RutF